MSAAAADPLEAHEHSVVDGVYLRTSPSQLHSHILCERAWYFDKVKHYERKSFAFNALGVKLHGQLEHYLLTGEDVLDPIARAGKHLLPAPGPDLLVERNLLAQPKGRTREEEKAEVAAYLRDPRRLTLAGVPVVGYVDFRNRRNPKQPHVGDHKTSSSIEKWAKTPEELARDAQAIIYCESERRLVPEATSFRFSHFYYQTKGTKRGEAVSVVLDLTTVAREWEKIEQRVERMKVQAALEDPNDVPANDKACTAYGGCSFQKQCSKSPTGRFMSLLKAVKNKNAAPAAAASAQTAPAASQRAPATPPSASTPPAASAAPAGAQGVQSGHLAAALAIKGHFYVLPSGARAKCLGVDEGEVMFKIDSEADRGSVRTVAADAQVLAAPSPSALSPGVSPGYVVPVVELPKSAANPKAGAVLPSDAPASNPALAADAPDMDESDDEAEEGDEEGDEKPAAAAPVETPKRGRGRPPKNASTSPAPAAQPLQAGALVLYVDCAPSSAYANLAPLVGQIAADLASAYKLADVRLADEQSPLGYGKWKAAIAAAVREQVPTGPCVIMSGDLAAPVIEALSAVAAIVVRPLAK